MSVTTTSTGTTHLEPAWRADVAKLCNEIGPMFKAARSLDELDAIFERHTEQIVIDFWEHAPLDPGLSSPDKAIRLQTFTALARSIELFVSADWALDPSQAKELFDTCAAIAGFEPISNVWHLCDDFSRADRFGLGRRREELEAVSEGRGCSCGWWPWEELAPPSLEGLNVSSIVVNDDRGMTFEQYCEHFVPTDSYLDWYSKLDSFFGEVIAEPTGDRQLVKLRELMTEIEMRMTGSVAAAVRTAGLPCAMHGGESAEYAVYTIAKYAGAGGDLDVAVDGVREVARIARLSALETDALIAQVRTTDFGLLGAWKASYENAAAAAGHDLSVDPIYQRAVTRWDVLVAENLNRLVADMTAGWDQDPTIAAIARAEIAGKAARAKIDKELERIPSAKAIKGWSTDARDHRLPKWQCDHKYVDANPYGGSVTCRDCGVSGTTWNLAERHFGFCYSTQPVELLHAIKRDLYGDASTVESIAERIESVTDFLEGPDPEYVIDDIMLLASICVIFGLSTAGKSFLVIDQGLCIASGRPWHGHTVKRSKVLFVVGESAAGYRARIKAWCKKNGVDTASLVGCVDVMPCSVNLYDPNGDVGAFVQAVNDKGYDVIVFDTLSRMMGDADDNSAHDFNVILNNTKDVQGMCWYVHHTTKDGATYRGSGNIMAASDTMILCEIDKDKVVTVSCFKQKEGDTFPPVRFQITTEGMSAVLVPVVAAVGAVRLNASQQKVLDALKSGPKGPKEITLCTGLSKATVTRALNTLVSNDVVERDGSRYML